MKENISKIENLLAKEKLLQEDKETINTILAEDPEAKDFYEKYLKIQNVVTSSSHFTEEEIGEYILSKETGSGFEGITDDKVTRIGEHLKNCSHCNTVYINLAEEYSGIGNFINRGFAGSDDKTNKIRPAFFSNRVLNYSVTSAISLVAIYLIMLTTSMMITPKTVSLAKIDDSSINYVTRGRATEEFQKGLAALDNNDYQLAVKYFNADAEKNKEDETIFYIHYILGLTYLEISENDFIGMFRSYDKNKVESAIHNFEKCIRENSSGNYPDISANSYFYLGKAELMLDNKASAREYFRKVIDKNGSKNEKAREILKEME